MKGYAIKGTMDEVLSEMNRISDYCKTNNYEPTIENITKLKRLGKI